MGPGDYWQVGEHTVELIDQLAGVRASDAVLDVDCGLGRIAWPLSRRLGRSGRYVGLDAASAYVDWCNAHLHLGRRFRFVHADVRTSAYNVDGSIAPENFVFPFPAASFDLVVATSIFTHPLPAAAANYLEQISRALGRDGRLFASFFLLDEAGLAAARSGTTCPTFSHPLAEGLLHDPEVPEGGIAYDPSWVTRNLEQCGLELVSMHPGIWKGDGLLPGHCRGPDDLRTRPYRGSERGGNRMRASLALLQVLLGAGLFACASAPRGRPAARIDHLVIGVVDLAVAIEQIAALTGVRPVIGGEHPGRGTHNALLSLGDGTYLELIAARPGAEGPDLAELRALDRPTPIDWAVAFDDFEAVNSALRGAGFAATARRPGSRKTPSGGLLEWETFGLEPPLVGAPFFIRWLPGTTHPSETSPAGCSLRRLEIAAPDAAGLTRLRDTVQLPVDVVASEVPAFRVTLQCPSGVVSLPAGE